MFDKVLIANRGEIACRVARTCRRLGAKTVAIHSDIEANAPHVQACDEARAVGPGPVHLSYLNIEAIVAALRDTGAQAVHPGYGLLSEQGSFAEAVAAAGAVFVGPSPHALRTLGDKLAARAIAREQGLTPPEGSLQPISGGASVEAERIGYPVLLKAAAGGGGIGMSIVERPEDLRGAEERCRARAAAAFGDDRIYVERYLSRPRHIEVQLLRDSSGNVAVLGERECSVQRRHQKVLEEAPSPAAFLTSERRKHLFESARSLLDAVDYTGAATVETICGEDGTPHFLEVNARLQVEHPVTELCTGLDLVEAQLRIAAGEELSDEVQRARLTGHAVEARLYAEDPDKGYMPQPGTIERLVWPEGEGIRVDTGVVVKTEITPYYDPLIAKICAHGATRRAALERLSEALRGTEIEVMGKKAPRRTNLDLLRRVVRSDEFARGDYDTHLLEHLGSSQ